MWENLDMMEAKNAPFVRHDIYGCMGRGPISLWEKVRLGVALLCFVPMKVLLLSTIVISYYLICRTCTMFTASNKNGTDETPVESSNSSSETQAERDSAEENGPETSSPASQENYAHLTGLRRFFILRLGLFFSRIILFVLGFYWIRVTRRDRVYDERFLKEGMILVKSNVKPSAIVSNHVSYMDILYHTSAAFPGFVAKKSVAELPIIGLVSKCLGCVYVQREEKPSDARGVAGIVKKRMQAAAKDPNAPLLMLFPEGTTTNGFYLLPFKTGAFIAGTPVQPVILKYPYRRFCPAWDTISGASFQLGDLLYSLFHRSI